MVVIDLNNLLNSLKVLRLIFAYDFHLLYKGLKVLILKLPQISFYFLEDCRKSMAKTMNKVLGVETIGYEALSIRFKTLEILELFFWLFQEIQVENFFRI